MAQHGSLLLSLLFVISVSKLAVICALGEAEMWSACLVEHSVASWGDNEGDKGTLLQCSSTGESRVAAFRERAALWVWFWLFLVFLLGSFYCKPPEQHFLGIDSFLFIISRAEFFGTKSFSWRDGFDYGCKDQSGVSVSHLKKENKPHSPL